jgi:flagellin-like protein
LEQRGVSPVIGTIVLIAITVALAAIVATLVGGLSVRGAPQNALLKITAKEVSATSYTLTISHEGGDDLAVKDLQLQVSTSAAEMTTYDFGTEMNPDMTGTFSVGMKVTTDNIPYTTVTGQVVSVYIIHKPSKQKVFSSPTVAVQSS